MLGNILNRSSTIYSKRRFIEHHNQCITYNQGRALARKHEGWIKDVIINSQLQRGISDERQKIEVVIAYLSFNSPELLLSLLGCINIGTLKIGQHECMVRVAMLNARWSAKEITQALSVEKSNNNSNRNSNHKKNANTTRTVHVTFIIYGKTLENLAKEACSIMNSMSRTNQRYYHTTTTRSLPVLSLNDSDSILNKDVDKHHVTDQCIDVHNEALILFTSGTTSGPKGVILSHFAMFIQAMAKIQNPCSYDANTKMLASTVPLFHVGGINSAFAVMLAGGCLVFPKQSNFSFDPRLVLESIPLNEVDGYHTGCVDTLVLVPAMVHAILKEVQSGNVFNGVRLLLVGGQNLSIEQLKQSQRIFPNARIVQTYACTEAGSSITFAKLHDPFTMNIEKDLTSESNEVQHEFNGTYVGIPSPHIELAIFELNNDTPTMRFAQPYELGAIGTKGPHVMNGYWKRGNDTDGVGIIDQWLITNDVGYIDRNGGLYFCGRLNDVIRTGGETVFAPEVESILSQHPNIDECAVFGLPDEQFGECVCAAIVLKEKKTKYLNNAFMIENIREFCQRKNLSGFKRPRRVIVIDDLPRNASGKVLKHELRRRVKFHSKL